MTLSNLNMNIYHDPLYATLCYAMLSQMQNTARTKLEQKRLAYMQMLLYNDIER